MVFSIPELKCSYKFKYINRIETYLFKSTSAAVYAAYVYIQIHVVFCYRSYLCFCFSCDQLKVAINVTAINKKHSNAGNNVKTGPVNILKTAY